MTMSAASGTASLSQLAFARQFALNNATHYPQIVEGVLPAIGSKAGLEQRRWGADFLAETLATPAIEAEDQKQKLSLLVLKVLKEYLETPGEDTVVVKNAVQLATSVYPLIFKYTVCHPEDGATWQNMAAIKSNILKRMDMSPLGIKLCCIKFIQRVVQVQSAGVISDPRRSEENEASLALVPPDHPLIPTSRLQAEALGLLDRLLNVFQDSKPDAILVTATINSIGVLVRTRPPVANRILSAMLSFTPYHSATYPLDSRAKIAMKSMERTIRAFMLNLNKRNPNHPLAGRVQSYLDRLQHQRAELFDESRKRPAASEPTDGLDTAKRQRLDAEVPETSQQASPYASLPSGPVTLAQLYTLTQDENHKAYDVTPIPKYLLDRIIVPILSSIDDGHLNTALDAVRARWLSMSEPHPSRQPPTRAIPPAVPKQQLPPTPIISAPDVSRGPFTIPQPPPLTAEEVKQYGQATVSRIIGNFDSLEASSTSKNTILGFQRLAASLNDRDSWVTVVARLATRTTTGLGKDQESKNVKQEDMGRSPERSNGFSVAEAIRDALHLHVLEDFRKRIDVAICWLNEEWYNDRLQAKDATATMQPSQNYPRCCLKLLDSLLTYLDSKDRFIIRFMSELPAIDTAMVDRIKSLALDPDRVTLAVQTLHFLVLYRPPVREICLDAIEDLWRNNDSAKTATMSTMKRWRPLVLGQTSTPLPETKAATPVKPVQPAVAV
ncbi:MAG: hypothetical protein M1828_006283 [Chrysothrix sp. TS-e1954]|nr:MAG: hypothetical protein M1828_006283 [Chrysothrix sp. TS-e1954]